MSELEEQKKLLLPFLQRAEEIQQVEPKVAYYCRMYAVDQGLRIPKRVKEIDGLINAALRQLEKDKPKLQIDLANDKYHCENFAMNIFDRADRTDRAGRADLNTSKAYYAASIFFEILNQFGEIDSGLFEKQRYAAWRAAEIRKAVREGRPPLPPAQESGVLPLPTEIDASAVSGEIAGGAPGPDTTPHGPSPTASLHHAYTSPHLTEASVPGPGAGEKDTTHTHSTMFPSVSAPPPSPHPGNPRFEVGSRVLFSPNDGQDVFEGTVGQVIPPGGPNLGPSYKVALKDAILEVPEFQLAPNIGPGGRLGLVNMNTGAMDPGTVLMVDNKTWPHSYLIRLDTGKEATATAHQVQHLTARAAGNLERHTGPLEGLNDQDHPPVGPGPGYPALHGLPPGAPPPPFGPPPGAPLPPFSPPPATSPPPFSPPAESAPPRDPTPSPPDSSRPPVPPPGGSPTYPAFGARGPTSSQPGPPQKPHTPQPVAGTLPPSAPPVPHLGAPAGPLTSSITLPHATPGYQPSLQAVSEAQKCARYAVSSLSFDDVPGAVQYLMDALKHLTQPPSGGHR